MAYNGSGTFNITTAGQPVVTGTVISSTAFNALTADLATGLSTAITKDGQTTTTARIVFAQGVSSTLTTDATSATTGSIITAGGISTQKALWVGTTSNFVGAMTAAAGTFSGAVSVNSLVVNHATFPEIDLNVGASTKAFMYYDNANTRMRFGTNAASSTFELYSGNAVKALTFDASANASFTGNLGIGMTPTNVLDITQNQNADSIAAILNNNGGANVSALWRANNGTNVAYFGVNGTGASTAGVLIAGYGFARSSSSMSICTGGSILFGTTAAEWSRINSSGSLCVNATSTIFAERQRISYNGAGEQGLVVNDSANTNGSNYVIFYTNGAQRGSITNNAGTGVLFNVSSDERLKTWRTDQRDFRSMILGVDVGDVEWKSVPGSRTLAVMAQQTNEFYPDAITPGKTDADMWQADYSKLAPLALWGVKDLYKIIDELTTRLAALESK